MPFPRKGCSRIIRRVISQKRKRSPIVMSSALKLPKKLYRSSLEIENGMAKTPHEPRNVNSAALFCKTKHRKIEIRSARKADRESVVINATEKNIRRTA